MINIYKSLYILPLIVTICTSFDVDPQQRNSKFLLVELGGEDNIPSNPYAIFSSEREELAVGTDICRLPAKAGPCEAAIPRYYFDHASGKCQNFIYGGCYGNGNNFKTKETCEKKCGDICKLPARPGRCRAAIPRYYFDQASGKCQKFIYGGCDGNENNFETKNACDKKCRENALKQEGESCGFSRRENCGDCDQGLECDTFVEDACGVCILKPAKGIVSGGHSVSKPMGKFSSRRQNKRPSKEGRGKAGYRRSWGGWGQPTPRAAVDCQMCEWTTWNGCTPLNGNNGYGQQTRTRGICTRCLNGGYCGCQAGVDSKSCDLWFDRPPRTTTSYLTRGQQTTWR